MKKSILTLVFSLFSLGFSALAQTEVGAVVAPSATTFHTGDAPVPYQYIFPVNYGLRINHTFKRFMFSTGLLHFSQGMKFELEVRSPNNDRTGETYDVFTRAKAIMIPLNIDYNLISTPKTKLFGGVGIYAGYIYSQRQENTSLPQNWVPDPNITYPDPPQRFANVQVFDDFYIGLNTGIGLKQQLSDKFSLQVRPNFLFQLRKELPEASYAWTNRMMAFSLDVGLYYTLGRK